MSLALRRLFLLLVVTAVGFAGAPVHAGGLVPSHHGPIDQAIEHHEHQHDGARHDHSADVGCVESGHCFPVQLIVCSRIYAAEALPPNAWDMPDDIRATSLKPEASTPPPRSA
jgi:hypothetical protein